MATWNMPPKASPNSDFVSGSGVMKTPVEPAIRMVKPNVSPITPNIVPMVAISEGIPVWVTSSPFRKPTAIPTPSALAMPR